MPGTSLATAPAVQLLFLEISPRRQAVYSAWWLACAWQLFLWCSVVLGTASWEEDGVDPYSEYFWGGGGVLWGKTFAESWKPLGRGVVHWESSCFTKPWCDSQHPYSRWLSSWAFLWNDSVWSPWWVKSQGPSPLLRVSWLAWGVSARCI